MQTNRVLRVKRKIRLWLMVAVVAVGVMAEGWLVARGVAGWQESVRGTSLTTEPVTLAGQYLAVR